jgi:hypothetical protein
MKDEIWEIWNGLSLKETIMLAEKFNIQTLDGIFKNEGLRKYLKENYGKEKGK